MLLGNKTSRPRLTSFIHPTMSGCFFIQPIRFFPTHSFSSRNDTPWPGFVVFTWLWTITKRFKSVVHTWIPRIDNHLYWHSTTPQTSCALAIIGSSRQASMPSPSVCLKFGRDTQPGRWIGVFFIIWFQYL